MFGERVEQRAGLPGAEWGVDEGVVGREADAGADGAEREATAHAADLLLGQPEARRPHEGAVGRDDRPQPEGHQSLVPEQKVQGQKTGHRNEAADAAGKGNQISTSKIYRVKLK